MNIRKILKLKPATPVASAALPMPRGLAPHVDWETISDAFLWHWGNAPERSAHRTQGHFHPSSGLHHESETLCTREVIFDLLCAVRTPKKIPARLHKILDNGTSRHKSLQAMFHTMAKERWMGIVGFEDEVLAADHTHMISGSADGILTRDSGHRYVLDFKTIGSKPLAALRATKPQHLIQLNTYQGMLKIDAGYMIYENKDNQAWAKPSENFFHRFDAKLYQETQRYCKDTLKLVAESKIPEFDEARCSVEFCSYQGVCERHRNNRITLQEADRRSPELKKKHLQLVR